MHLVDALRKMMEAVRPRHVVVFHPKNDAAVRDAAKPYYVDLIASEAVAPGKVYLIDREAIDQPPPISIA